jgi:hypothetical protein
MAAGSRVKPSALAGVVLALLLAGCSSVTDDIENACELGLTRLHATVTEREILACASTDEAILIDMATADRAEAEACIACVARTKLHAVLCFDVCDAETCTPYGLAACDRDCGGRGLQELCARGGMPAQHPDLR